MGRSNVKVVVRARPTSDWAKNITFDEATNTVNLPSQQDEAAPHKQNGQPEKKKSIVFDKVLVNSSQKDVFNYCAKDVVSSVMDGFCGTIMAYGQTGAGKTHTMRGRHSGYDDRGIVPRAITEIYKQAQDRSENKFLIRLSYVEIYNELMFDLLTDVSVAEQAGDLAIVDDPRGGVQVRGLSTPVADTDAKALTIYFEGESRRAVADHALNKGSTRSHVIFTIYLESKSKVDSNEEVKFSRLHLVDLAGSERVKKSGSEGVTLKEATHINKSLTFLEQVVIALGNRHRDHVPYRHSKLTHMLKDSLGGPCKTTMVANIWPEVHMLEETLSTIRFAKSMKQVQNEPTINVQMDPQRLIKKYKKQIEDLKMELAMHDTLAGKSRVNYLDYSPDEKQDLESKITKYLKNQITEIDVTSRRMAKEAFPIFKKLYEQLGEERPARRVEGDGPPGDDENVAEGGQTAAANEPEPREGDGDEEEGRGISVGIAPDNSKPAQEEGGKITTTGEGGESIDGAPGDNRTVKLAPDEERAPDKQVAFAEWKSREGQQWEEEFDKYRDQLKTKRTEMREALVVANTKKTEIDDVKETLARKQADKDPESGADEELIDDEEFRLIKTLKDAKNAYKDAFEKRQRIKAEVDRIEDKMSTVKSKLVSAFEDWYDNKYNHLQRMNEGQHDDVNEPYDAEESFQRIGRDRLQTQEQDAITYFQAIKSAGRGTRRLTSTSITRTRR